MCSLYVKIIRVGPYAMMHMVTTVTLLLLLFFYLELPIFICDLTLVT